MSQYSLLVHCRVVTITSISRVSLMSQYSLLDLQRVISLKVSIFPS